MIYSPHSLIVYSPQKALKKYKTKSYKSIPLSDRHPNLKFTQFWSPFYPLKGYFLCCGLTLKRSHFKSVGTQKSTYPVPIYINFLLI